MRVYFNEFNVRMGKMCYLPLVSGLLRVYAETSERVRANYQFMPFIYHLDSVDNVMAQYTDAPDVAAFSVSMWNEQLNLHIAAEVKRRWPACLIVFGGMQVPHDPRAYMRLHTFIDVAVRAEGEEPFLEVLNRLIDSRDFAGIANVSYRLGAEPIMNTEERPFKRDLDSYPSPYLEGVYDELIAQRSEGADFQAIIETNRGCPFQCTFCAWGRGGLSRKYRYHDMDRVLAEIDWCGRNKILYVFNADSNFGMHARDKAIADFIVETKKRYGFPEKFRTCFGKNTDEQIFQIGTLFHRNDLEKGITLARQSNTKDVLKKIKRGNIKMSVYESLQHRFNDAGVPIYSEMILGLPGETYQTWKDGVEELLTAGLRNQLFTYLCQVLVNTELADPEYMAKYGIVTRRVTLNEIHGSVRSPDMLTEYEDIIVQTDALSIDEWRRSVIFSWVMMSLHSMKLGYFIIEWLRKEHGLRACDFIEYIAELRMPLGGADWWGLEIERYNQVIDGIMDGIGRGTVLRDYGDIYWDVEEATFLRAAENTREFYGDMIDIIGEFMEERGKHVDVAVAQDIRRVIAYQQSRIPEAPDEIADRPMFARRTILWGRKSGTLLLPDQAAQRTGTNL